MLRSKALILVVHSIAWLLFFALIIGFVYTAPGNQNAFNTTLLVNTLLFFAVYIFLFYFNGQVLFPKLALRKHYVYYLLVITALIIAVILFKPYETLLHPSHGRPNSPMEIPGETGPPHRHGPKVDIISIILFFMIWSISSALQILKQWRNTAQRAARAEADKANAELSFLKAQINPHFLFNTLNNIYALAVTKNEATPASIMKLSNIMRYVTDEVSEDYVPLESEVECISNYIDLQRLRLNTKVTVDFSVTGNVEDKKISPLILMTFVENVFKYGISKHEEITITIKLYAEEKTITFFCQNKIFPAVRKIERTGIGIANTRQRLEFLYPNKHLLNITTANNLFTVQLTLQL